jgi:hypothetical protein
MLFTRTKQKGGGGAHGSRQRAILHAKTARYTRVAFTDDHPGPLGERHVLFILHAL